MYYNSVSIKSGCLLIFFFLYQDVKYVVLSDLYYEACAPKFLYETFQMASMKEEEFILHALK